MGCGQPLSWSCGSVSLSHESWERLLLFLLSVATKRAVTCEHMAEVRREVSGVKAARIPSSWVLKPW